MYTLPSPRYSYYEEKNFQVIQNQVTAETNKLQAAMGFYQPRVFMGLLQEMELLSTATLLLGLVFSIIVILFIVISILLIYSLLMISVETKSFENGVLRLVGLSKANCVHMILV
jgi:ABC-type antimicrobial peptide transport system permease subunit